MWTRWLYPILLGTLAACGGGGGGDAQPDPGPVPPTALSYPAPPMWNIGDPIAPLTPTVSGTVTRYSVAPPLPAGIAIDEQSGAISGSPTAASAAASYVVTASNAGGGTSFSITMSVRDIPPVVAFAGDPYTWKSGTAITPLVPQSTGGTVVTWGVDRALPAGLHLDTATGVISGTPTHAAGRASYRITASNSGGSFERVLSIGVQAGDARAGVLLDLGHGGPTGIRMLGTRAISEDGEGWVLWNLATRERIASGPEAVVGHSGDALALRNHQAVEMRSVTDGGLVATITVAGTARVELSADASYLVVIPVTGELQIWSTAGALLAARAGNFSAALAILPARDGIGVIAENAAAIETLRLDGTTASTQSFTGGYWKKLDQENFVTWTDGSSIDYRVYSYTGQLRNTLALRAFFPPMGTWNDYVWAVSLYDQAIVAGRLGSGVRGYPLNGLPNALMQAPGSKIGFRSGTRTIRAFDFVTTQWSDIEMTHDRYTHFTADGGSEWLAASSDGLLVHGTGNQMGDSLTLGKITHVDANDARIAVATASGKIAYFDGGTLQQQGTLDFGAKRVRLSSDGSILLAMSEPGTAGATQRRVNEYSLPSGSLVSSQEIATLADISLSGSGSIRALTTGAPASYLFTETPDLIADQMVATHAYEGVPRLHFAPGEEYVVYEANNRDSGGVSHLRRIGQPGFTPIPGNVMGWLDDQRILVNRFTNNVRESSATEIYDRTGGLLGSMNFGLRNNQLADFHLPSPDRIYLPATNSIRSLSDGTPLWTGPSGSVGGAIAGPYIIFQQGRSVLVEPH
jgi:hypothetical protein